MNLPKWQVDLIYFSIVFAIGLICGAVLMHDYSFNKSRAWAYNEIAMKICPDRLSQKGMLIPNPELINYSNLYEVAGDSAAGEGELNGKS